MECPGVVTQIENYGNGRIEAQAIRLRAPPFPFHPGQFVQLSTEAFRLRADPLQKKWTSYSIASLPGDDLQFVYTVKPTGGFTQFLAEHLRTGDQMGIRGPFGNFTLQEDGKRKVFIATGAGIAPIMSMLRSLDKRGEQARLYFGFRTADVFLFRQELEAMAHLQLETIASRDPSWATQGYVQDLLKAADLDPHKEEAYLCGNGGMIAQVTALLQERGFPPEAIRTEQW